MGTGSYGALPSLGTGEESTYTPSSLSASTASEDDRKESDPEDENGDLAPLRLRKRAKRKGKSRSGIHALDDTARSRVGGTEGLEDEDGAASVENSEEEDEDEEDPVDNSP